MRGRVANPWPIVRWNAHKGYLLALAERGISVVETTLVPRGDPRSLAAVLAPGALRDVVIKPAVSAGSFATIRSTPDDPAGAAHFRQLVEERDVLVQPYLPSVEGHGERAVVVIDGEVTHAVRKSPRFANGSEEVVSVPLAPDEAVFAARVLTAAREITGGARLLYARVDTARDASGEPVLMELELIEPSLFFGHAPHALDRFVAAVARLLL